MKIENLLKILTDSNGVSGFEEEMAEIAKKLLSPFCDEVYENRFKSVIGIKKSKEKNAKRLMIEAHLDKIGLMVSEITKSGFLKIVSVGGVDPRILPGSEVYVLGKEKIYGVIGAIPPHLKEKSDKEKMPKISEMLIDTGLSYDEVSEKISVGDCVIFKNSLTKLLGGEFFAPAMDNRAGMTAVLWAAEEIQNAPYDIYFVFSSEEELGLHGAYTAAGEIKPDIALVIDVTHGMTPDTKDETGVFKTGSGAIICKGPNFDDELASALVRLAKENNIKYDIEVAAGNSGTNAWVIQNGFGGSRTLLISIPLKYMHTSVETLDISDIEETGKLIRLVAKGGLLDA